MLHYVVLFLYEVTLQTTNSHKRHNFIKSLLTASHQANSFFFFFDTKFF